jgi:3-hydroxyacyl-CoA dehydrogenase
MKKIDLNRCFKDVKGLETAGDTIADVISKALFMGRGLTLSNADEKYAVYRLSIRIIAAAGAIELSDAEVEMVKKTAAALLTPGGYGQIVDLLEGDGNGEEE